VRGSRMQRSPLVPCTIIPRPRRPLPVLAYPAQAREEGNVKWMGGRWRFVDGKWEYCCCRRRQFHTPQDRADSWNVSVSPRWRSVEWILAENGTMQFRAPCKDRPNCAQSPRQYHMLSINTPRS